jgi:hypothetical protein
VTASATKAGNENALWKYFGLSSKGQPYQAKEGSNGKLDLLAMQMESIAKRMDSMMTSGFVRRTTMDPQSYPFTGSREKIFLKR